MLRFACVTLVCAAGVGSALAQPADVSVRSSDRQLEISWTAEAGVTYNLYIASEPGVTVGNIDLLARGRVYESIAEPFTLSGLDNNRTYFLIVGEVGTNGAVFESEEASGTPRGAWATQLDGTQITSVAADPMVDGVYLAGGAGEGAGCDGADKVAGCEIFRSDDSGLSWASVTATVNQINIQSVAIFDGAAVAVSLSANNGTTAGPEKVLASGDGVTWALGVQGVAEATPKVATIDPNNPMVMYAGNVSLPPAAGQSRILRSTAGGVAWSPLTELVAGGALRSVDIAVRPGDSQIVWLGGDGTPALVISSDGGATFTEVTTASVTGVTGFAFDGDNPDRMWVTGASGLTPVLMFSDDGGATFSMQANGLPGTVMSDVAYDQPTKLLFVATQTGVFVSADHGMQFERLGVGLENIPVSSIAIGPSKTIVAATATGVAALDLTPPPDDSGEPDAGVDAGGGGGGGGGCCQSTPGGGRSAAALAICVLIATAGRRRRRRAGRTRPA